MGFNGGNDLLNIVKTPDIMRFTDGYNIPKVKRLVLKNVDEGLNLVEFHGCSGLGKRARKQSVPHFFLNDYLFERVWNDPKKNLDFLSTFKAVLSPDFSQYTDMPRALNIYNHYRKMWVSAYWQAHGLKAIPVAGWSDEESFEYCFDGMPKNSLIAVSTVGVMTNPNFEESFRRGFEEMMRRLEPAQLLLYGKKPSWLDEDIPILQFKPESNKRFEKLREQEE